MVKELVFFLEEQSAKEMLNGMLPRLFEESLVNNNVSFRCIHFQGKQDMKKKLKRRLRNWQNPNACFVVIHDQDQNDCIALKNQLVKICQSAGKPNTLVRIICRELESWYLGDLRAVESALGIAGLAKHQNKQSFRYPDRLQNPKQKLKRLTKLNYQQISSSREIGHHLSLEGNRSNSFNVFISGVRKLLQVEIL